MKKATKRRYRLHGRIRRFARVNTQSRAVFVTEGLLRGLSKQQLQWIDEIKEKYYYNIQFEIG